MDSEVTDLSEFVQSDSDQLNADDLIAGPRIFTVQRIRRGPPDKRSRKNTPRLVIYLHEHPQPYKPCKGMTRLMLAVWGQNPAKWPDDIAMELYRDPTVQFGTIKDDDGHSYPNIVGGVRISGLSHLKTDSVDEPVTTGRGQRTIYHIRQIPAAYRPPTLAGILKAADLTTADLDAWRASIGKDPIADLTAKQRAALAVWLARDSARLDTIRDFEPAQEAEPEADPEVEPESTPF